MNSTRQETKTETVYFAARKGKVMTRDSDEDRAQAQMYVNRNNAAAARRGDFSKPYTLLSYKIPA